MATMRDRHTTYTVRTKPQMVDMRPPPLNRIAKRSYIKYIVKLLAIWALIGYAIYLLNSKG